MTYNDDGSPKDDDINGDGGSVTGESNFTCSNGSCFYQYDDLAIGGGKSGDGGSGMGWFSFTPISLSK